MITLENLQVWGLTRNEAKLISYFIKNRHRKDLTFKKIQEEIKTKRSFYREVLQNLLEKKFLFVIKEHRPITYQFNENRFKELFQEKKNEYLKGSQEFDLLINKMEVIEDRGKILDSGQAFLSLTTEQVAILKVLLSENDHSDASVRMTLKQIGKELEKEIANPAIRYNLSLLEKKGFVIQQKIGRTNFYQAKNLEKMLEIERKFQDRIWNEKRKQMQDTVRFLEEKQDRVLKKIKSFEVKEDLTASKNSIKNLMNDAKNEILIDFRCNFNRTDTIKEFLDEIFNKLLEILRNKRDLKIKLLINVDDWLIHNLNVIFTQFISMIKLDNFEIREPIDKSKRDFRIIMDEEFVFQLVGVVELTENETGLEINDASTARQVKLEFNQIWDDSLDVRDSIFKYQISQQLEDAIKISEEEFPPHYNFSAKFVEIIGLRKAIKFLLRLINNIKNEMVIITGPIFVSSKSSLIAIETLSKENFYDRLHNSLKRKSDEGVKIRWIRNTIKEQLAFFQTEERKKWFIDFSLTMYPNLQYRQLDLEKYQFAIIDKKILCIFDYIEEKITLINDDVILNEYYSFFERCWDESYDIRFQWFQELSNDLKDHVETTFNKIPLQITLPKEGEIKKFDGRFLRFILGSFLQNTKNNIFMFRTFSQNTPKDRNKFSYLANLYFFDYVEAVKSSKLEMKMIISYLPDFINMMDFDTLKTSLEIFERFQIHILPKEIQSSTFFGIFDNFIILFIGNTDLDDFYLLIANAKNLRDNYIKQFWTLWDQSFDIRQVIHEYGSLKMKELLEQSYKKFALIKKLEPKQIREKFPLP